MPEYKVLPAGDTALVVEFGDQIDRQLSTWCWRWPGASNETGLDGIIETRADLPLADGLLRSAAASDGRAHRAHRRADAGSARHRRQTGRTWRLPVCYDAAIAPDLDDVAARTGLTPAQVIERHSAHGLSRLYARLPAGHGLSGRRAERARAAAAGNAAAQGSGRLARDRHDHDLHLSAGDAVRLASHRPLAGAVSGSGGRVRRRCWRPATR